MKKYQSKNLVTLSILTGDITEQVTITGDSICTLHTNQKELDCAR
jgi:hypothetical protein